jgi:tRNA A37 threonylcarbamoyladenosine modification protein TsaB
MKLLVVPLSVPFMIGVYDSEGVLVETHHGDAKISDALLPLLEKIFKRYDINEVYYVNGPGSHMATKIAYVMLKTAAIVRNIPLYGCSAFAINEAKPVKAIGKLYFVKEKETIITKRLSEPVDTVFDLPHRIVFESIRGKAEPDYRLPAV